MSHRNLSVRTQSSTRAWKYDDSPRPDWLDDLAGDLQPNGTFSLPTDAGLVRVHPGDVVIECGGSIWVRSSEEAGALMESIELEMDPTIMTIGPGKMHHFGKKARRSASNDRRNYPPPVGTRPSIEWIPFENVVCRRCIPEVDGQRPVTQVDRQYHSQVRLALVYAAGRIQACR